MDIIANLRQRHVASTLARDNIPLLGRSDQHGRGHDLGLGQLHVARQLAHTDPESRQPVYRLGWATDERWDCNHRQHGSHVSMMQCCNEPTAKVGDHLGSKGLHGCYIHNLELVETDDTILDMLLASATCIADRH